MDFGLCTGELSVSPSFEDKIQVKIFLLRDSGQLLPLLANLQPTTCILPT